MNALTWVFTALGLIGAPEALPHRDIPFYVENPEIRRDTLRRCHDDSALASLPTCRNAEAAGALSLGRPLSSWPDSKLPLLPPSRPRVPETQNPPVMPGLIPVPGKGGDRAV